MYRFYGISKVVSTHQLLTGLASTVGMLLIGVGHVFRLDDFKLTALILVSTILYMATTLLRDFQKYYTHYYSLCSVICVVSTLIRGIMLYNEVTLIGAALLVVSGIVGTSDTKLLGIKRVDIFHYTLGVSVLCFAKGLLP